MRALAFVIPILITSGLAAHTIEFMGLKIDAKSVTFVCDGSKWTQDKDDELIYELGSAIDAMSAEQQVAVVFFADGKAQSFGDAKPVPATVENRRKLRSWLKEIRFTGDSTPVPGFARAIESQAETIVFVTSGEFRKFDETASAIESLNKDRKARVHAVSYFQTEKDDNSRSFMQFMKRISERTGGKDAVAYADELRRKR